jgi:hypothetical protein
VPRGTIVTGLVTAGPVSPVDRPGQANTAQVTKGQVIARAHDGSAARRADIGADGTYRLELPPGRYTLTAEGTGAMRCNPEDTQVPAGGGPVHVDITCDTGIR